jgi:hypothetical protein
VNQEFDEIMERITVFLKPIVLSIKERTKIGKSWNTKSGSWE